VRGEPTQRPAKEQPHACCPNRDAGRTAGGRGVVVLFVILPVTLAVSILAAVGALAYMLLAGEAGARRRSSSPHGA
jgi:hypothetical protein